MNYAKHSIFAEFKGGGKWGDLLIVSPTAVILRNANVTGDDTGFLDNSHLSAKIFGSPKHE